MKLLLKLALVMTLVMTFCASASAFTFTIYPGHYLSPQRQAKIERALSWQVNVQVAQKWSVTPATFVPSGGAMILITNNVVTSSFCSDAAEACHNYDGAGFTIGDIQAPPGPFIIVDGQDIDRHDLAEAISHEVVESEVDPTINVLVNGHLAEVCDPVEWDDSYYGPGGIALEGWVYPAYFFGDHTAYYQKDTGGYGFAQS